MEIMIDYQQLKGTISERNKFYKALKAINDIVQNISENQFDIKYIQSITDILEPLNLQEQDIELNFDEREPDKRRGPGM